MTGDRTEHEAPEEPGSGLSFVALDRSRRFWTTIGYAVVFGLVLAFAGLAFLGLVTGDTKLWFTLPENPDWFSGSLWWVAATAVAVLTAYLAVSGSGALMALARKGGKAAPSVSARRRGPAT